MQLAAGFVRIDTAAFASSFDSRSARLWRLSPRVVLPPSLRLLLTRTQLTELVDAMDRTLDAGGSTTAMQHTATRHREILADYTRDFKRTQTSLREAEQRANLLGSVREEISAFRQSTTSSATEQLLSERGKIDSSNRMTDDILGSVGPH